MIQLFRDEAAVGPAVDLYAPAVEEALYILVKSYERLGMQDLSSDANRVLVLNFPDSQIMQTGQRVKKEREWWQLWNK